MQYPNLGRIIAVSSGKGGVGKSTVAVNPRHRAREGRQAVGIMDADIYGPILPLMLGVDAACRARARRSFRSKPTASGHLARLLIEKEQPAIWRGPIVMKIITQFLRDVNWGKLDYFPGGHAPGHR